MKTIKRFTGGQGGRFFKRAPLASGGPRGVWTLFRRRNMSKLKLLAFVLLMIIFSQVQFSADEVLCYTERVTNAPSFNIYTGRNDPNNPIKWNHTVPAGILDSVVRVGLYIEAWDVDYPPDGDEYDRVYFNGYDLGHLVGSNDSWFTVEKTVPVSAIKEGINNLEVYVDEAGKTWKVTIRASELRFYCSTSVPDFSIGVTPKILEINQGESAEAMAALTGLNGFNSAVTLSLSGLPANVSAVLDQNPLTPNPTAQTKINLTAAADAPEGTYTLTLTGEGSGKQHETTFTLKIKKAALPGDFSISSQPQEQEIFPGDTAAYEIKLNSVNNFTAYTFLSINGLPEGASATFEPEKVRPTGTSALTVTTTEAIKTGKYNLTVTGKRDELEHSIDVVLNVVERPPDPDFQILAQPVSRSISRGQTAEYTLSIKSLNDFDQDVALSLSGLPQGVSARFSENSINLDTSGLLQIESAADSPVGDFSLTLTGKGGGKEHSITLTLTIDCPDFSVRLKPSITSGPAPLTVDFDTNISIKPVSYTWNFGDGTNSSETDAQHTYSNPGVYTAVVTVTDGCGQSRSASAVIEVEGFEGSISNAFSVAEALPGDEVYITIEARNQTHTDFENIIIRDPLSAVLQYIEDDAAVDVQRSGSELRWLFPRLERGEAISFKIKARVPADAAPGVITNIAYLTHQSLGLGKEFASNTASLTVQTVHVTLKKQVVQTTVAPGGEVKYLLTLTNNSTVLLGGINVTDYLQADLEFLSQTAGNGLSFDRSGGELRWTGHLDPGASASIIIKARVKHNVFNGTRIENTAKVEADHLKEAVESNRVVTTVTSEPVSSGKVSFSKRAEVPQADVGRVVRFRLTLANRSNATLVAPQIEDYLPQGFQYVADSTLLNNQTFSDPQGKRRLIWQLPDIRANETFVIRYQVVIGADARRGRNVNRAILRATDTSGQVLSLEASAFVNVSAAGFVFYSGVEGTVYLDRDHDEFYSLTDTPLEGIEVRMSSGEKAFTDALGQYRFENLFPGEYAVNINRSTLPEKYSALEVAPKIVVLSDGLTDTADFAVRFKGEDTVHTARLEGRVFYDKNRNLSYEHSDRLAEKFKAVMDHKVYNGSNGRFVFTNLKPGSYSLEIRYGPKTVKTQVILKDGKNNIDIPLTFTGIKIIVTGEGQ